MSHPHRPPPPYRPSLLLFLYFITAFTAQAAPLPSLPTTYPSLLPTLATYAVAQGFTGPTEKQATIYHELIHIDSAANQGYNIRGVYYAPYNTPSAWPTYTLAQFRQALLRSPDPAHQALISTPVFRLYITNTPNNTLASLADELNAYGQSAEWLCQHIPQQTTTQPITYDERTKTLQSMRDTLRMTNAFLAILQREEPAQYYQLNTMHKQARNLLALTIINADQALTTCGSSLSPADRTHLDAITQRAKKEAR